MLFNSITFLVFFALVFATYWGAMAQHVKRRNAFILLVSYVFYGWWDWRFLSLIFVSSLSDYLIGLQLAKASEGDKSSAKKGWLALTAAKALGDERTPNVFYADHHKAVSRLQNARRDPVGCLSCL